MTLVSFTGVLPVEQNISAIIGDDIKISFVHDLGESTSIQAARFWLYDPSASSVVLAKELAVTYYNGPSGPTERVSDDWDFSTENLGVLTIPSQDTEELSVASYSHAVELVSTSDRVFTPTYGVWTFIDGIITDATGLAAPLSIIKRGAIQDEIDLLALAMPGSRVTSPASSGASTIQTADTDDAIFSATDDVYIELDDGTWQLSTNITSASSGLITLNADTLDGDVSQHNIVRKVV